MSAGDRGTLTPATVAFVLILGFAQGCASAVAHGSPQARPPEPSVNEASSAEAEASAPPPTVTPSRPEILEEQDPEIVAARLALAAGATPERHRALAALYLRRDLLDSAFDHYAAAIELSPADSAAHEGLARVWRDWGFNPEALNEAHRAVFYAPTSPAAYNTLGTVLLNLGQLPVAEEAFAKARSLSPAEAYILNNLCFTILLRRQTERALESCAGAVAMDPQNLEAGNNLALAHAAAGDFEAARLEFDRSGSRARSAYNLGIAYVAAGRLDEAATAFQRAWEADRTLTIAGERLRQINQVRGRSQK